jgi:glycosyltransferase involved in cell wall biosynthesis
LVHPTGGKGGGMMRVADYLRGAGRPGRSDVGFELLDVRGDGPLPGTPLVFARETARLQALLRQGHVQLVHLFVGDRLSLLRKCVVARMARRAGVPVLMHLHAYDLDGAMTRWPRPLCRFVADTFARAEGVVVLGPQAADDVTRLLSVAPSRLRVIANGVAAPTTRPAAEARRSNRFLFCGNLSERKGVGLLLQAFAQPELRNTDASLVLAGGGDLPHYAALARSLGIQERVSFIGWQERDEVSTLLAQCRALVLPSNSEALPLAVLEALGHGIPCITTPVGELPRYTEGTDALCYVPPGARTALAEAISTLATDDALAARLSAAGRTLFERHFELDPFVDAMYEAYRAILDRHAPAGAADRGAACA